MEIISEANTRICEMTGQCGMFVTGVCARYDKVSGEMNVVSAGHNPVYILRENGLETIESTGTPLGLFPENAWQVTERRLEPGDVLFLYTDGLVEAHREDGEQFEDERLMKALEPRNNTPRELIEGVFQDAETFCEGTFDDDVTMLAVRATRMMPTDRKKARPVLVPDQVRMTNCVHEPYRSASTASAVHSDKR